MLDRKLQEYYEELLSTFGSKGWKLFEEDTKKMLTQLENIDSANTTEQFWVNKGRVDILRWLLNFPHVARTSFDELLAEETP